MNSELVKTLAIASVGVLGFTVIYRLARRQKLSFRYAIGWLVLSGLASVAGVLVPTASPIATWLDIAPGSLVAASGIFVLLLLCVQLSISISGMQMQIRRLSEEIASIKLGVVED